MKDMENYKIAVMLNGHPKHLDITQHLFGYWNSLYENIKFDFFLSLWETIDNDYESFDKVLDYGKLDWVTKWETLKEEDCPYDLKSHPRGKHQPHYTYTLKKVNELRNSYDEEYDAVLQLRCDVIIFTDALDKIVNLLIIKHKKNQVEIPDSKLSLKNIFSEGGSTIFNRGQVSEKRPYSQNLWTCDYFFYGHPKVMDVFCGMFDYIFIDKKYSSSMLMHVFQAEYLHLMGIYNSPVRPKISNPPLIREHHRFIGNEPDVDTVKMGARTIKVGARSQSEWGSEHPSPNQLKRIIEERGLDYFFNHSNEAEIKKYFVETDKE